MKNKKILVLALIVLLAVVAIGSVSAAENTTIRGINFTIPDGFQETDNSIHDNVSTEGGLKSITDMVFYQNESDLVGIMVLEFETPVNESVINDSGEKTNINGVDGYLKQDDDGYCSFVYIKDKCIVTIMGTNQDIIKEFVTK